MRLKMEQMDKESSLLEKIKQKKLIIALIVIGVFISMSLLLYAMNPIGLIQGCFSNSLSFVTKWIKEKNSVFSG